MLAQLERSRLMLSLMRCHYSKRHSAVAVGAATVAVGVAVVVAVECVAVAVAGERVVEAVSVVVVVGAVVDLVEFVANRKLFG